DDAEIIEIRWFCDASNEACAAVIYVKSIDIHGQTDIQLVSSKTKLAPLKPHLTIPKLELTGAVLLARLVHKILKSLTLKNVIK
ncbi:hypothetical protein ILUMI_15605, partial [Ignelater luminosus]